MLLNVVLTVLAASVVFTTVLGVALYICRLREPQPEIMQALI
jgi:hypothetical protein